MRFVTPALGLALVVSVGLSLPSAEQAPVSSAPGPAAPSTQGRGARAGGAGLMVLSPKAASAGWTGVHKPHTKLVDVVARHRGQSDWTETIVDDESLFAQWISMGPAAKTTPRMNGDTREWWIVQSGQIKFTIEGQEPVIASKGHMVQVPYRTLYQLETIGNEPSLRFEVNVTKARKLYPMNEKPAPVAGFEYIPTRVTGGRGSYDDLNRMTVDFNKVVTGEQRAGAFVSDDRGFANIILGAYQPPPAMTDKGHYHEEGSEFWLIMLGKVRYHIGDLPVFEAEPGDVVYAPRQTWHLASNGGEPGLRSCRLALNGYPFQAHMFDAAGQ